MKCVLQLLECCTIEICKDGLHFAQGINQTAVLSSTKDNSHSSAVQGYYFDLLHYSWLSAWMMYTHSWLWLYAILLSTFWHLPLYFTVMKSSVLFPCTQQKLPHMPSELHAQFPWLIPTILTVSCCFLLLHLAPPLFIGSYILFLFNIHSDFQAQNPHTYGNSHVYAWQKERQYDHLNFSFSSQGC